MSTKNSSNPPPPPEKKKDLFDKAIDAIAGLFKKKPKPPTPTKAVNTTDEAVAEADPNAPVSPAVIPAKEANQEESATSPVLAKIKPKTIKAKTTKSAQTLTKAYITAFILIAIISIAIHLISSSVTGLQKQSIQNGNTIIQERLIIEQIVAKMDDHYKSGQQYDFDLLSQGMKALEENHIALQTIALKSPALGNILFSKELALDQNIKDLFQNASTYIQYGPGDKSVQREQSLTSATTLASTLLVPVLEQATLDYQSEIISEIEFYNTLQLFGLFAILVTLGVEAALIFYPLARKINEYEEKLTAQAQQDQITKLLNRAYFIEKNNAVLTGKPDDYKITFIFASIDGFADINDQYGVELSDRLLRHFAMILTKSCKNADSITRLGGGKFAVSFPLAISDEKIQHTLKIMEENLSKNPCPYLDEHKQKQTIAYTAKAIAQTYSREQKESLETFIRKQEAKLY